MSARPPARGSIAPRTSPDARGILPGTRRTRDERAQASVELVALLPLLALILLGLVQASLAGYAAWSATTAARAGARAYAVGADVERAVRRAAPIGGADARITRDEDVITVRVHVPSVLPIAVGTIAGAARFEAQR